MDGTTSAPEMRNQCLDYARVEDAIRFIDHHRLEQPSLDEIAAAVNASPYHFQRLFSRWAGVSPKRFLGYLTLTHARAALEGSGSVLDAALEAGLSGPGRLHDLFVTFEAVTPGDVRRGGDGLTVRHGVHPTLFGDAWFAATGRGLCDLSFVNGDSGKEEALAAARERWPKARFIEDRAATGPLARAAFTPPGHRETPLALHVQGTNFQIRVWEALLRVPEGRLISYRALAEEAGAPRAARAVGTAMGRNPVAYLIPCHRVIRQSGALSTYRWGRARRMAIIGWEAARKEAAGVAQSNPSTSRME